MRNVFARLWADDQGTVALEYLALSTVIGLTVIIAANMVAAALNVEYSELSGAISGLDQDYSAVGYTDTYFVTVVGTKAGSGANGDLPDPTDKDVTAPHDNNIDVTF